MVVVIDFIVAILAFVVAVVAAAAVVLAVLVAVAVAVVLLPCGWERPPTPIYISPDQSSQRLSVVLALMLQSSTSDSRPQWRLHRSPALSCMCAYTYKRKYCTG